MSDLMAWLRAQFDWQEGLARQAIAQEPFGFTGLVSPRWVLREVDALRSIADEHARVWIEPGHPHFNDAHLTKEPMPICRSCEPMRQFRREESWPCLTLRLLALPYVDRPGYRVEWAPSGLSHIRSTR